MRLWMGNERFELLQIFQRKTFMGEISRAVQKVKIFWMFDWRTKIKTRILPGTEPSLQQLSHLKKMR